MGVCDLKGCHILLFYIKSVLFYKALFISLPEEYYILYKKTNALRGWGHEKKV
jgi:hypothetical protein